ncbi:phosphonate ABC transporter, permease protein PhnE [Paracoccus sp. S-4012]|uniref:phosphonate ABC transporter, permease protein PhnE n=1 Tax=Paracoccus sp. S-4012 TaxID=2665648 RepID=UPI0012AEE854|nr:phosphonate ABC transporter, permease protein PhnE [Paracoccus sp. S-4012]MRX52110.1 phosphonate ABC transporter, permease protein PhnE [Paracoccus sp. S-4012]
MTAIPLSPAASDITAGYLASLRRRRLYSAILLAGFASLFGWSWLVANDRTAGGFLRGLPQVLDYPAELLSEAWESVGALPGMMAAQLPALIETINIAAVSTLLGAGAGGLLALLAAPALTPWPRLVPVVRRILDVTRAIPDIVIALVLIFVLGGGPVPAMLAIAFHTTGALGKLFSEVADNADLKPVEGLSSVGATWLQRMGLAVMPQVAPNWLSYALLRFEINIRASAILGFVGAGGIGSELRNAISWGPGRYDQAAAVFLLLFLTIVVVDQLSGHARDRLIRGTAR